MPEPTTPSDSNRIPTGEVITRAESMVARAGRTDLVDLLAITRHRWEEPSTRVMVVGEFKQGKSALVNALLNAPICRVADDVSTAVPTVISHSDQPGAVVVDALDQLESADLEEIRRTEIPLDDLARFQPADHESAGRRVQHLEVSLPREVLKKGLVLVDTPGVGGLRSSQGALTVAALPTADAVLFVSDATAEYSATEIDFLKQTLKVCPNVTCVTTKIDLQPDWRRIVDLNRDHLQRAGIKAPILPVSSLVRDLAIRLRDATLNSESGFDDFARHVDEHILGETRTLASRSVFRDVLTASENVRLMLRPELAALEDPSRLPGMIGELEQAMADAEELRQRSARWQITLSDGIADLRADLEHDLKDRMRALIRDCETSIDAGDPGVVWDGFSVWLEGRCSEVLTETFTWVDANTGWLCDQVGEHFTQDAHRSVLSFAVGETGGLLQLAPELSDVDRGHLNLGQKLLIGMRGSYGGVLMFGLLTSMAGLSLVNPISLGAGLILGAKAYHDEKANRLQRRRQEAKSAVRRHLDDVQFQVLKTLRDRLRLVQRNLRDYYTQRAEELQRSLKESLDAARTAAQASKIERDARMNELRKVLAEAELLGRGTAMALGLPQLQEVS